jgi:hypothetical protein
MYARVVLLDWHRTAKTLAGLLPRWIFRGQASSRWDLRTTLERAAIQKYLAFAEESTEHAVTMQAYENLSNREDWILTQFQRRAHLVMDSPPPAYARLDWLAAIQHYGGPTRLLDFTHSFYVATFFAVEQAVGDAVWAFWAPRFERSSGIVEERIDHMNNQAIEIVENVLRYTTTARGVINVEPFRLNERMAVQKGVFVLPLDISVPFMESLRHTFGVDFGDHDDVRHDMKPDKFLIKGIAQEPHAVKFVFPRAVHDIILSDLAAMNIDAGTLFPGLQGYARSMNRFV